MSAAVELENVTKDYGRVRAVDALSLSVPEGSLYGLIGPNGAGKTTTFAMLSGFLRPTAGEVKVRGVPLSPGHPPVGQILALPQDAELIPTKKVLAQLVFLGRLSGMTKDEAEKKSMQALERVSLADLADRRVNQLSHGQRRRVGIAQTLVGHDEVIILDEPTAGLDPRTAVELGQLIKTLKKDRTVILSSHNLAEVESLCSHAAILDRGKLVASGTMDEIKGTGALFTVLLTKPLADPDAVLGQVRAVPAVMSAKVSEERDAVAVECDASQEVDDLTNQVLTVLLQHGASVKSVERGKSLEQRFMETTRGRE